MKSNFEELPIKEITFFHMKKCNLLCINQYTHYFPQGESPWGTNGDPVIFAQI